MDFLDALGEICDAEWGAVAEDAQHIAAHTDAVLPTPPMRIRTHSVQNRRYAPYAARETIRGRLSLTESNCNSIISDEAAAIVQTIVANTNVNVIPVGVTSVVGLMTIGNMCIIRYRIGQGADSVDVIHAMQHDGYVSVITQLQKMSAVNIYTSALRRYARQIDRIPRMYHSSMLGVMSHSTFAKLAARFIPGSRST